jgi:hypothetical protein
MDRDRFDALTRLLATPGSRRAAISVLLGTGLVAKSLDALAKKPSKKDRDKGKAKKARNRKQQKKRARAEAAAGCCKSGNCSPGTGKNLTRCCFEGQTLTKKSFKSSNLTEANFTGANLTNANFASTNLTRACLVDATITGANFKSANLSGVVRCRTKDGANVDDSGCHLGTPCCPTCTSDTQCGDDERCCEGRCQAVECCDNGIRSTCDAGELCCAHQCVSGICCDAEDCRPRGNNCVSAGGGPTACICGSGTLCPVDQTCCPAEPGPTNAGTCANLATNADHCGRCGHECGTNEVCRAGACVCPTDAGFKLCGEACVPATQCCDSGDCSVCQQCVTGSCQALPTRRFACDGSPLVPFGSGLCTTQPDIGVCIGGACSCEAGTYDSTANVCRCNASMDAGCDALSCQGCQITRICVGPTSGSFTDHRCLGCP